tara:strand:+ start:6343 stop:6789 length:447 start_codon:yes stop_codon:yes gene_type:complete
MAAHYTISQLAKAAGIPVTTVRYYERIKLVVPETRSTGNYRLYSDDSLKKLMFIRAAQAIGFTLEDIKSLLATESGKTPTCGSVQKLIETRFADIEDKLKDLRHVRKVLKSALAQCHEQKRSDRCHVVTELRANESTLRCYDCKEDES